MPSDSQEEESTEDTTFSLESEDMCIQYISNDMMKQYFNSALVPMSGTEKAIGEESHEFMSMAAAIEEIVFTEVEKGEEEDGDLEPEVENPDRNFKNPEFLTKVQIRSASSKIRDLVNKWEEIELEEAHATLIMSSTNVEKSVEKMNEIHGTTHDVTDIDPEKLTARVEFLINTGVLEEYGGQVYRRKLSELVIPFYLIYQTYVDEKTVEKINKCVIEEQYRGTNGTYEMLDSMSQPTREELLERTGSLEPHHVSKMCENRRIRNSLVHSLYGRSEFDMVEDAAKKIDRCEEVLAELEGSSFSW